MSKLIIVPDHGVIESDTIYRVRIGDGDKIVDKVGTKKIQWGYGFDRQESIKDFIRRNDSDVIERVFNAT